MWFQKDYHLTEQHQEQKHFFLGISWPWYFWLALNGCTVMDPVYGALICSQKGKKQWLEAGFFTLMWKVRAGLDFLKHSGFSTRCPVYSLTTAALADNYQNFTDVFDKKSADTLRLPHQFPAVARNPLQKHLCPFSGIHSGIPQRRSHILVEPVTLSRSRRGINGKQQLF